MIINQLDEIVSKLDINSKQSLESAIGSCVSQTHYNVEIEHWLLELLKTDKAILEALLSNFDCDIGVLTKELLSVIERFKRGNGRTPSLSPKLIDLLQDAWITASINFKATAISSVYIIYTLIKQQNDLIKYKQLPKELEKI